MFKNFYVYDYGTANNADLVSVLANQEPFYPCPATAFSSAGWSELNENGDYSLVVGDGILMAFRQLYKVVPLLLVKKRLAEAVLACYQNTGRMPGKKERRDLRDDVIIGLLPGIIPREKLHYVWFGNAGRLIVEASSSSDADKIVTAIARQAPDNKFFVKDLHTKKSLVAAAVAWLLENDDSKTIGNELSLGYNLKLQDSNSANSTVTVSNVAIRKNEQVQQFLREGYLVKNIELGWQLNNYVTVTDNLSFKRLSVDVPEEQDDSSPATLKSEAFAHVCTIDAMVSSLVEALK